MNHTVTVNVGPEEHCKLTDSFRGVVAKAVVRTRYMVVCLPSDSAYVDKAMAIS